MAKRNQYKEKLARVLYEHTSLNKTALTMQKSWKEADKALETLKNQFQEKFTRKKQREDKK